MEPGFEAAALAAKQTNPVISTFFKALNTMECDII
jgi:hypothetical protein